MVSAWYGLRKNELGIIIFNDRSGTGTISQTGDRAAIAPITLREGAQIKS
jgi:hypothetical protein